MEATRILWLLSEVKDLFGQYLEFFLPVSAAADRLGHQLLRLKSSIQVFTLRSNEASRTWDLFRRLTVKLYNTLSTLKYALASSSHQFRTGSLAGEWHLVLDSTWIEHILNELSPLLAIVEIINEAMELLAMTISVFSVHPLTVISVEVQGSTVRTTEATPHSRRSNNEVFDSSLQLQTLTGYFFHGITSHTRINCKDQPSSDIFTSSNIAHHKIGTSLATRLDQKTREAMITKSQDEALWTWKIRHSIYWLCKSTNDMDIWKAKKGVALKYNSLPARDKNEVAPIFSNALKAAWLANKLELDLEDVEVRNIVLLTKEKVLKHMSTFYENPFTTPNYDLIDDLGNFDIDMAEMQKPHLQQKINGVPSLSSPASPETQLQESPLCSSNSLAELEALTAALPSKSVSQDESTIETVPPPLHVTTSIVPRSISEAVLTSQPSSDDGLHIVPADDLGFDQGIAPTPARLHEIELHNEEIESAAQGRSGFACGVFTIDPNPPLNTMYIRSSVRVFRLDSAVDSYLTLNTYRDSLPKDRRVIQPSTAQLVPEYAFMDSQKDDRELYIRDSDMQNSLRYKFHCHKDDGVFYPWELYGFQGALMRAHFEGDYSANNVMLHRQGSQRTLSERFPRIQVWTDFPIGHNATNSQASPSTLKPTSIDRRHLSALSDQSANVNDSRIFIFSRNYIYFFFSTCLSILIHC